MKHWGGIMCGAMGVAGLATPGLALEPLSPAGSYGNVCAALQRVANAADVLASSDTHANLTAYTNALIGLGFSVESKFANVFTSIVRLPSQSSRSNSSAQTAFLNATAPKPAS